MAKIGCLAVEKTAFHFDKLFKYIIPKTLEDKIKIGSRVIVPFGSSNSLRQGMVLKIEESEDINKLKIINSLLNGTDSIGDYMVQMISFLHFSCFCTWYDAVKTVIPVGFSYKIDSEFVWRSNSEDKKLSIEARHAVKTIDSVKTIVLRESVFTALKDEVKEELIKSGHATFCNIIKRNIGDKTINMVTIAKECEDNQILSQKQKKVYDFLKESLVASIKETCYNCGVTKAVIDNMIVKGILKRYKKEVLRMPTKFLTDIKNIDEIKLNKEQQDVFLNLDLKRKSLKYNVSLLKGVTGSGKTVIFVKLIDQVIKEGKQSIILVPEISLTPQLVSYFNSFFGNMIAVLHSGLTMGEKVDEYKRIERGEAKIVIGTRSAIFAPLDNLGLIIMDEEGEASYKSSDMSPRYHARDIAKYRAKKSNCTLLLASATPSIETEYLAKKGEYSSFELKRRYRDNDLPEVILLKLNEHPPSLIEGVSLPLAEELAYNFENKQQSILLLNRRGYNSSSFCIDCGYVKTCDNCSAAMTYHKANDSMVCHYCGNIEEPFIKCPLCGGEHIVYSGQGTQKIEEDLKNVFKSARILRMDADTTYSRFELEQKIKEFEKGSHDILIGTQIVAKGLNFPNVTLVGVLSADSLLYGADFRCRERLFSLLTQVVGRSGRGDIKGRAVIQTYRPDNQTLIQAADQNYDAFYCDEIKERKVFFCPPFCDLCSISFSGLDEKKTLEASKNFLEICKEKSSEKVPVIALGISSPYLFKLGGRFRKRIILKCIANNEFRIWMKMVTKEALLDRIFSNIRVSIDINGEIT